MNNKYNLRASGDQICKMGMIKYEMPTHRSHKNLNRNRHEGAGHSTEDMVDMHGAVNELALSSRILFII